MATFLEKRTTNFDSLVLAIMDWAKRNGIDAITKEKATELAKEVMNVVKMKVSIL